MEWLKAFLSHYPALQPWQLMIYRTRELLIKEEKYMMQI